MSKAQIYLGYDLLDFTGVINVKRQVKDYRDPAIGTSNKSYTLEIPLTPTNQGLLNYVSDIRSRLEVTDLARIMVDSIEIIKGKLRILSFTSLSVKAIIEADDWVDDISGTSIQDLSWASGDEHAFTSANIVASWTASAGALYRYPLISFSELISEDYGSGGSAIYPYEFYPMWNVEDIVTKLLMDSGYTLAPNGFFSGTYGKALYILSKANPYEDDFISGKALKVYVDDDSDNYSTNNIAAAGTGGNTINSLPLVLDVEVEDEGNDFNISTNRYTAPADGTYRFQSQVDVYSTQHRTSLWTIVQSSIVLSIRKNGTDTLQSVTDTSTSCFDLTNQVHTVDSGYVHLEAGDYIEVVIYLNSIASNDDSSARDAELYVEAGVDVSYFQNVWSEQNLWPGIGRTMSPSDFLPDMEGIDFLKGLKEAYNLRFWMDRNNRTMYVETSNDFYGDTVIDWTDRIDYSEEILRDVLVTNYRKTQRFRWRADTSDKAYTNEVAANGVPFQHEIDLTSEYAQPGVDQRYNALFSPTVNGNMPQIGTWGSQIVPRIFGSQEFVSSTRSFPAARAKNWQPRIFEWLGMIALGDGSFDYYDSFEDTSPTNYTTFPRAKTPDMSDLYTDYMLKDFNRIDKNKMITCVVKLTAAELIQFHTVVGTAAEEGFRAKVKLNIEGSDMYFLVNKTTTDGDRVKLELVQKL